MNRPVVIVDPLSSGIELAPAFKARGIPCIAISLKSDWVGYGMHMRAEDFIKIIPEQPNLVEILKKYNPLAILPGTEKSIALAEQLTNVLTPQFANSTSMSHYRRHKAFMQDALRSAGIPVLNTLNTHSESEVEDWINENKLADSPLIIKPPMSAGSDKVFHIAAGNNWKKAFQYVLKEPAKITGKMSESVVVQEEAIGTEYAVGTVSANGKHYLAHLIKYNKFSTHNRKTIYDYVEFVPYHEKEHSELFSYTCNALNALGIKWGASHNEIMMTANGPRLIESSARMCGGPVVTFAREATGSSQADRLVEAYVDGDILTKKYVHQKSVFPIFLKSAASGVLSKMEVFKDVNQLPTFLGDFFWYKNGDRVPETVDYLTSLGIIALAGNREEVARDYNKIRKMEAELVICKL